MTRIAVSKSGHVTEENCSHSLSSFLSSKELTGADECDDEQHTSTTVLLHKYHIETATVGGDGKGTLDLCSSSTPDLNS